MFLSFPKTTKRYYFIFSVYATLELRNEPENLEQKMSLCDETE